MNLLILAASKPNGFIMSGDFNKILWSTAAVLVILALILWKGRPAIKNLWNGRIERLAGELDAAASARAAAEAELAEVESSIANADAERNRILAEARETAAALRAQIIAKAGTDAAELRARGLADADAAKAQAASDLQAEVAVLALGAAEAVVANALDPSTQSELIDNYISRVGAQS